MSIELEREISDLESNLRDINELNESDLPTEIIELKNNLIELIGLKKQELLICKKAALLEKCDININEKYFEAFNDDIIGSTRSIDFRFNNGVSSRRNIFVYEPFCADNELKYICFFSHPVYRSELPCKMFLNNNYECKYKDSCKYFHGVPVTVDNILDPVDLAVTISEGDLCLCLIDDGDIWRKSRVLFVDCDSESCVIELVRPLDDRAEKTFNVTIDRIVRYADADAQCDEADSSLDLSVGLYDNPPCVESTSGFGAWERHTRGIGMKLLLKMGYRPNAGLGKNQQGRLESVAVTIPRSVKSHKFIDRHVAKKVPVSPAVKATNSSQIEAVKSALVRNEDRLLRLNAKIESLEQSKMRNSQCKSLLASADAKIDSMRNQIAQLHKKDKDLQSKLKSDKSAKKKLRIF